MKQKSLQVVFLIILAVLFLWLQLDQQELQPTSPAAPAVIEQPLEDTNSAIREDGSYTSKEDVAAYLFTYKRLPQNFITKAEARKLGWVAEKGNLWKVTDHKSIGGDSFSNAEGLLPKAKGRKYYEADINYQGGPRGAERIVFSNDGLVFYTSDHYQTFTELKEGAK